MLLRPTEARGAARKRVFADRMTLFENGEWARLLADAAADGTAQKVVRPTAGDDDADVLEAAVKKV